MRGDDDVVIWLLRALVDRAKLSTNTVQEVEREARIHWGGRRPYIPRVSLADRQAQRARRGRPDVA